MTLLPAYGRTYKSAKMVKIDWEANLDFIVADMFSQFDGKPVNKEQLLGCGFVNVRYPSASSPVKSVRVQ